MALIHCTFDAKTLRMPTSVLVAMPPRFTRREDTRPLAEVYASDQKYKTLYLLHGAFDDYTSWSRKSNIERYAAAHNLMVVMPDAPNSFYVDQPDGPAYWSYLSEELPLFIRSVFPSSAAREDNYTAGLSMGGYGALKLALHFPRQFSAAVSLSGLVDPGALYQMPARQQVFNWQRLFGSCDQFVKSNNNLEHLVESLRANGTEIPRMLLCCGTSDELLPMNRAFHSYLEKLAVAHDYAEGKGGHDWDYWDLTIRSALSWIVNDETEVQGS